MTGVLAVTLAACGGNGGGEADTPGEAAEELAPVVVGTTDQVTSFDPAGSYDLGSWTIIYNTYQRLMSIPPGGNEPEPDAAESCELTDETVYTCTLKEGLTFHDGSDLTAEDVAFSLQRVIDIADPNGPSSLLSGLESVEATDELTVTMNLTEPNATWPFVLTTGAGAIVPADAYPGDALQPSEEVIGSGPYSVETYEAGQRLQLAVFEDYQGPAEISNGGAIVQYYDQPSALKLGIEQADVDVAYRSLSPTDIADLRDNGADQGVQVVDGEGTEIRYIVFNVDLPPGEELAARQAMAMLVDRASIAENVYNGTVEPLYSMVPQGLQYATEAFAEEYGEEPDPAAAQETLEAAGISTPVDVTLWWTPTHYGASSADEFTEIQRQLEADGLFSVTLESAEWQQYSLAYSEDQYPAFQLGWFPDFPDADNYTAPFFVAGGFYNSHYENPRIEELVAIERASPDEDERAAAFEEIQQIAAEEVPTIPLWQGNQVAAVQEGVEGVAETFDPSFTFRFWLISKSE
jgi:peptide/nickel transport system substrate-binding protein